MQKTSLMFLGLPAGVKIPFCWYIPGRKEHGEKKKNHIKLKKLRKGRFESKTWQLFPGKGAQNQHPQRSEKSTNCESRYLRRKDNYQRIKLLSVWLGLFQLSCGWCFHPTANEEFLSHFAQSRAGEMQLRITFNLMHCLEPAISWKQILIALYPFIYRQWTLSWSEHCQLQNARFRSLACRIFPFWNIPDVLLLQL